MCVSFLGDTHYYMTILMKINKFSILYILRVVLGLLFIFSAIFKLISIDQFEVYVYSFGFISLNASFIFARICIGAELLIGIGLASNLCGIIVNNITYIILCLFCVFLCYNIYIGRNDSCQCFGSLININPVESFVKNILLLLWTWLVSKVPSFNWKPRWYIWIVLIASCLVFPFIISEPDHWRYNDKDRDIPYNVEMFNEQIITNPSFVERGILYGNKIVAFVSPYCPYCKMSIDKLQTIQQRYNLPDTSFIYSIPQPPEAVEVDYNPIIISKELFSIVTYGQRPVIVFVSNGAPVQSIHYRAIDENEIHRFLSSSISQ